MLSKHYVKSTAEYWRRVRKAGWRLPGNSMSDRVHRGFELTQTATHTLVLPGVGITSQPAHSRQSVWAIPSTN